MTFALTVMCAAVPVLSGCSFPSVFSNPASGFAKGFTSAVAGDEPQSVVVAQQVLNDGGSAADAVIAGYFAMAVTMPTAASLGGGGVCMISDATKDREKEKTKVEALVFTHRGGRDIAAPANARGMYALHAKYGQQPWRQLLAPGESLARFGFPVSRALADALESESQRLKAAPGLRLIFTKPTGEMLRPGDRLQQIDLASTLGRIRRAPRNFIIGDEVARLAAAYRRAGMPITQADIEGERPEFLPPLSVQRRNQMAEFPPTPAGAVAAQLWAAMYRDGYWRNADDDERPHAVAEVSKRVYADAGRAFHRSARILRRGQALLSEDHIERLMAGYKDEAATPLKAASGLRAPPPDLGSASIMAADRFGQAVACAFTMNRPLGAARLVPRTGIVMAAPPAHDGPGWPALALMVLRLESQNQLEYLGAATGGGVAPVALVTSALEVLLERANLEAVQKKARYFHGGTPDQVIVERGAAGAAIAKALRAKGHAIARAPRLGRLNAFICPAGFEGVDSRCEIRTDPRGLGYAEGK
ncbi:MAG: gamma-glutamyltransferase [Alphaproteobacteria bacterium]|nr:gamma-glutamyltransferase [Alphaproteobacteria bacterium]